MKIFHLKEHFKQFKTASKIFFRCKPILSDEQSNSIDIAF